MWYKVKLTFIKCDNEEFEVMSIQRREQYINDPTDGPDTITPLFSSQNCNLNWKQ